MSTISESTSLQAAQYSFDNSESTLTNNKITLVDRTNLDTSKVIAATESLRASNNLCGLEPIDPSDIPSPKLLPKINQDHDCIGVDWVLIGQNTVEEDLFSISSSDCEGAEHPTENQQHEIAVNLTDWELVNSTDLQVIFFRNPMQNNYLSWNFEKNQFVLNTITAENTKNFVFLKIEKDNLWSRGTRPFKGCYIDRNCIPQFEPHIPILALSTLISNDREAIVENAKIRI